MSETWIPEWVVYEVGRLHLHALALERELAALRADDAAESTADDG